MVSHDEDRLRVVNVAGWMGLVHPVGEGIHLNASMGLEGHPDLPGYGVPFFGYSLWDIYARNPCRIRHIILPATPHYRVPLAHQEAITWFQATCSTVNIRQRRGIAPVYHIKQNAVTPLLGRGWLEDEEVC